MCVFFQPLFGTLKFNNWHIRQYWVEVCYSLTDAARAVIHIQCAPRVDDPGLLTRSVSLSFVYIP